MFMRPFKSPRLSDLSRSSHEKPKTALLIIYLSTLLMRGCFYLAIAMLTDKNAYPLEDWQRNVVFIAYPLTELLTVSFFGAISDRIGKLPIYMLSYVITAIAMLIFSFVDEFYLLILTSGILGLGIAAKVSSTLALVAELSTEDNRGRNMGIYDASTLIGLGLGFGLGFLVTELRYGEDQDSFLHEQLSFLAIDPKHMFLGASLLLVVTLVAAYPLLRNKVSPSSEVLSEQGIIEKIKEVLSDPKMQHLLPIWVPVISLYGIVLANAKELAHDMDLSNINLIIVLGVVFSSILIGFPLHGILSDKYGRRPFLYIGMISFAAFVTILKLATSSSNDNALLYVSPLLLIIGIGCGAFPPAALALLADVSHDDALGTSFGGYSIVYGTGLIIGPALAAIALEIADLIGLVIVIWLLALVSVLGTKWLPEDMTRNDKK